MAIQQCEIIGVNNIAHLGLEQKRASNPSISWIQTTVLEFFYIAVEKVGIMPMHPEIWKFRSLEDR